MFEETENLVSEIDKNEESRDAEAYRSGYKKLFNGIEMIIRNTRTHKQTIAALKHLQICAEEHFIEYGED